MKLREKIEAWPKEKKESISLAFSMSVNAITLIGKIVLAILISSGFLGVSAMVTFLAMMTKMIAYLRLKGKGPHNETTAFGLMALTISVGAICYLSYMARLFFFPKIDQYNLYEGLSIAVFAFVDLGWAIYSLLKERKSHDIVLIGLKCGSLANGLSALLLAQIAILAFTNPGVDFSYYNAIGGMVFGGVDLLIGLAMAYRYFVLRKTANVENN